MAEAKKTAATEEVVEKKAPAKKTAAKKPAAEKKPAAKKAAPKADAAETAPAKKAPAKKAAAPKAEAAKKAPAKKAAVAGTVTIKLVRSLAGRKKDQIATAVSLGLTRVGKVTVQPDNAATTGKIVKISHLVEVTKA